MNEYEIISNLLSNIFSIAKFQMQYSPEISKLRNHDEKNEDFKST